MAAAENALITTTITVIIAGAVGYGLYKIISVKEAATASDYGRKWLAWMILIGTLSMLPNFFRNYDFDSFFKWMIVVVIYGLVAFIGGWIYGKYLHKKQQTNHSLVSGKNDD